MGCVLGRQAGADTVEINQLKIVSAYRKKGAQNFINSSDILYIDSNKKRVAQWSQFTGLQLPVNSQSYNSSTNSISDSAENSNSKKQILDTAYMESARNGDEAKATEYVEQAAIEQYFKYGTEPYLSDVAQFRYQVLDRTDISKALNKRERKIFYSAINPLTQNDGLRIGEKGILIPSDDEADTYKLVYYTNIGSVQVHDVYKLINHDYNIHEIIPDVARHIIELREEGYNEKHTQSILKSFSSLYGTVFKKYSPKSHRFVNYARSGNRNGTVNRPQPVGTGVFERIRQNGSGAKQLVYDYSTDDRIREQEAELNRLARESKKIAPLLRVV